MPVIQSSYKAPRFFSNPHLQTSLPFVSRQIPHPAFRRERIDTIDGDFIDIDWKEVGSNELVIISHGLEGSSRAIYVRGIVRALSESKIDSVVWNLRCCSGEPNRKIPFYHSGCSYDLETVISHILHPDSPYAARYDRIALIGYSVGGNINLKYLGERAESAPSKIIASINFSVPCEISSAALSLARRSNYIYMRRFMRTLREKVHTKAAMFPGQVNTEGLRRIRTFEQFDNRYIAPWFGFKDARDYWRQASCKPLLTNIRVPSLIVNALDDPFLGPECHPYEEAVQSNHVTLEVAKHGGHIGFLTLGKQGRYWWEARALNFLREHGISGSRFGTLPSAF